MLVLDTLEVTGSALEKKAAHLPRLCNLSLEGCPKFSSSALGAVGQACSSLLSVNCSRSFGIRDAAFAEWTTEGLIALQISACTQTKFSGLTSLLLASPCLRVLDVSHIPLNADEVLRFAAKHLHYLESLLIGHLAEDTATDDAVVELTKSQCAGKLSSFDLSNASELTNKSLVAIRQGCPFLVSLDIGGCNEVTEQCLVETVQSLRLLSSLAMGRRKLSPGAQIAVLAILSDRPGPKKQWWEFLFSSAGSAERMADAVFRNDEYVANSVFFEAFS